MNRELIVVATCAGKEFGPWRLTELPLPNDIIYTDYGPLPEIQVTWRKFYVAGGPVDVVLECVKP